MRRPFAPFAVSAYEGNAGGGHNLSLSLIQQATRGNFSMDTHSSESIDDGLSGRSSTF
jgi:hypothetical protein